MFECYLNKLLTANKQTIKGDLVMPENSGGNRGRIILKADSVENSNHQAVIETEIHILDPKKKKQKGLACLCRQPEDNPYLLIERQSIMDGDSGGFGHGWMRIYETEIKFGELDANFKKISINMTRLCDGNLGLPLRFSLLSH